jgi:hypothetical protein
MHDDLRILLVILMARFDGRVEIGHEEAAKARQWLAERQVTFVTHPGDRMQTETFTAEMRSRSRIVVPG